MKKRRKKKKETNEYITEAECYYQYSFQLLCVCVKHNTKTHHLPSAILRAAVLGLLVRTWHIATQIVQADNFAVAIVRRVEFVQAAHKHLHDACKAGQHKPPMGRHAEGGGKAKGKQLASLSFTKGVDLR